MRNENIKQVVITMAKQRTLFGKVAQEIRKDNDQTLQDMGNVLGVTGSLLSKTETGVRRPQFTWFRDIMYHYDLAPKQLTMLNIAIILSCSTPTEIKVLKVAVKSVIEGRDNEDDMLDIIHAIMNTNSDYVFNNSEIHTLHDALTNIHMY